MANDDVKDSVLDAARSVFNARGYAKTSMKAVAQAAGVAPDVVSRYYQSKDKLFAAAMKLPSDPMGALPDLVAPGLAGMGERVTRTTLETLGDEESREALFALVRAGAATNKAAAGLQDFVEVAVIDRIAHTIGVPDARLRANLIMSYLMGVAINRYVLKVEPLASLSDEDVVRIVSPTVQDWLTPTKPLPGSHRLTGKGGRSGSDDSSPDPYSSLGEWPDL